MGPSDPTWRARHGAAEGPDSNWINNYFANPEVFQIPAAYTLGDTPRAIGNIRSPFSLTNNASIMKDFGLSSTHKEMQFEVRLEAENALNHPIFGRPDTIAGVPILV